MPWAPRQHEDVIVGDIGNHHGGFSGRISFADGVADDFHDGRLKRFPTVGQTFDMRAFCTKFQDIVHDIPSILIELGPYAWKPPFHEKAGNDSGELLQEPEVFS